MQRGGPQNDQSLHLINYVRRAILECFRGGHSQWETLRLLRKQMGSDAPGKAAVYNWFNRFEAGDFGLDDGPRPGRPSGSSVDRNSSLNDPWAATALKMRELEANVRERRTGPSSTILPQPVMQSGSRFPVPLNEVKKEEDEDDMLMGPSTTDLAGTESVSRTTSEVREVKKEEVDDDFLMGPPPPDFAHPASTSYHDGSVYERQEGDPSAGTYTSIPAEIRVSKVNKLPTRLSYAADRAASSSLTLDGKGGLKPRIEERYIYGARKTYPCERPGCDMVLKTQRALRDHDNGHDGLRAYECGKCAKTFIARVDLANHLTVCHKRSIKAEMTVEEFDSEEGEEEAATSSTAFDEKRDSISPSNAMTPLFSNEVDEKIDHSPAKRRSRMNYDYQASSSFSSPMARVIDRTADRNREPPIDLLDDTVSAFLSTAKMVSKPTEIPLTYPRKSSRRIQRIRVVPTPVFCVHCHTHLLKGVTVPRIQFTNDLLTCLNIYNKDKLRQHVFGLPCTVKEVVLCRSHFVPDAFNGPNDYQWRAKKIDRNGGLTLVEAIRQGVAEEILKQKEASSNQRKRCLVGESDASSAS